MDTQTGKEYLKRVFLAATTLVMLAALATFAVAQATIQTGSIQGTVSDPGGLVVSGAKVTISNDATGQKLTLTANDNGFYNSGPLAPGTYKLRFENKGFQTTELTVPVQVGVISTGNARLQVGSESQVVTVEGTAIQVNTEQATVQGVLNVQQIENLPINGRNFLDLAQLEPGVQIQDASNFDPTKGGFTGISVGGRSGRTTRIEVDGLDISDETVGTTVANISASSIQEFQISQSSLDLSTELTSSGAVNVVTRSGTNALHGQGFYLFRDKALAASFPGGVDAPFQRNHFGGNLGGPLIRDKVFFFFSGERIKQDLSVPVGFAPPFTALSGQISEPLREKILFGRLDLQAFHNAKIFYRFAYDNNSLITNTLLDYSVFSNLNNTPAHAIGLDTATGTFAHSFRFGYTKFVNHISDAVSSSSVFNPAPDVQIRIGGFRSGPNPLAPQATFQSNKQFKYDGTKVIASHTLRYGIGVNRILGGGFANFFGIAPRVRSTTSSANQAIAAGGPFPGGAGNPLNYPVAGALSLQLGNGQGFFTEIPEFGFPAGGQSDTRFQVYFGDSLKVRPNFTVTIGLRYVRDTGRTNSDLDPIPCSAINPTAFSVAPPCAGNTSLLEQFGFIPSLGNRVRQDNNNFGPQVGIAWDPFSDGKTVVRAGAGIFYENAIFNNVLFSRPAMLQRGLFNFVADQQTGQGCPSGQIIFPGGQVVTTTPGGLDIATQVCGQPIGSVAHEVALLQQAYQAANVAAGAQANPQFIGELLSQNLALIGPNYSTPYSLQFNAGIQRELRRGMVFSADYVRNINLRYLVGVDTNHVGDARFFNRAAALNAIALTNGSFGCAADPSGTGCAVAAGATMEDYAGNGLTSAASLCGGPCSVIGVTPDQGAAFPGINPLVGQNVMLFSIGRSVYNGLQASLKQDIKNPMPFVKYANLQFSYSLSRFLTAVGTGAAGETNDQDFINAAPDFRNPLAAIGHGSFDRTHQFSAGTIFEFPKALRLSFIAHVNSPLSQSMFVEDQGRAGEIFSTDFTGDGTTGDLLPGSKLGEFMRNVKPEDLAGVIANYNSTIAAGLTPAGQRLVAEGLFTPDQLLQLGAITDTLPVPPANLAGLGWLRTVDMRVSVPIRFGERFTIEPSASFYNLFNFVNYDTNPTSRPQGVLNGVEGTISGTTNTLEARVPERAFQSSGVFGLGSARQAEFGLRITF